MAGGGSAQLEVRSLANPVQRERRQQFLGREVHRVLALQDRVGSRYLTAHFPKYPASQSHQVRLQRATPNLSSHSSSALRFSSM